MENKLYWKGILHDNGMVGVWENLYTFAEDKNSIRITVSKKLSYKDITIVSERKTDLVKILCSILRFENLFEGFYYHTESLLLDEADSLELLDEMLPFYKSPVKWLLLPNFTMNCDMNEVFLKWLIMDKKLGIVHNMFLYAAYAGDLTNDVKLALILQTFEPISEDLAGQGKINIIPHNHKNVKDSRILFGDRVFAIIDCYGNDIFQGEDIDELLERSVDLRNKIIHLDRSINETLNGRQAAYYVHKFILLYIIVILTELGIDYNKIKPYVLKIMEKWKYDFPQIYAERIVI